ncbi:Rpn family recombination-promoting nuclease/putative transposase [Candidatus Rickettsia barbariae]
MFYNGIQKYTAPLNLWELFENSELVKATWINDYQLINVHEIPDEKLTENTWVRNFIIFYEAHSYTRFVKEMVRNSRPFTYIC